MYKRYLLEIETNLKLFSALKNRNKIIARSIKIKRGQPLKRLMSIRTNLNFLIYIREKEKKEKSNRKKQKKKQKICLEIFTFLLNQKWEKQFLDIVQYVE